MGRGRSVRIKHGVTTDMKAVRMNTVSVGRSSASAGATPNCTARLGTAWSGCQTAGVGDFHLHDSSSLGQSSGDSGGASSDHTRPDGASKYQQTLRSTHSLAIPSSVSACAKYLDRSFFYLPTSTGEGEGGGEVGSQPDKCPPNVGHHFPPSHLPRRGGKERKACTKIYVQTPLEQVW